VAEVKIQRLDAGKTVTDTLMHAMESADKMSHVIILYETHEDNKSSTGGVITQDDVTMSKINWLLDMAKQWLFQDFNSEHRDD
jgi:hypothetical protein